MYTSYFVVEFMHESTNYHYELTSLPTQPVCSKIPQDTLMTLCDHPHIVGPVQGSLTCTIIFFKPVELSG